MEKGVEIESMNHLFCTILFGISKKEVGVNARNRKQVEDVQWELFISKYDGEVYLFRYFSPV